ncbi:MAG: hypothetical protein R3Y04_09010 [Rikenellaceae bacterium]
MENKIQQLTQQLYKEGVAKGKQESEELIAKATEQAASILEQANQSAQEIVSAAKAEAESQKELGISALRRTGEQLISQVKTDIQNLVVSKVVSEDVKKAFENGDFVKELMVEAVKAWATGSDSEIVLSVAQGKADETDKYLKSKVDSALASKLSVEVSPKLKGGFTISPKGEGYYISFTSEEFDALLSESLSTKVSEIVFGK